MKTSRSRCFVRTYESVSCILSDQQRLVTECLRRLNNAQNWAPYLDLLFCCFNSIRQAKLTELPNDLAALYPDLIPQLLQLEHTCPDSQIRERIHEIVFHLPIGSGNSLLQLLNLLMPFYIRALTGPDTLVKSGGRFLLIVR